MANVGSWVTINKGQDSIRLPYSLFLWSLPHVIKWLQELQASSLQDTGRKETDKS